MPNPTTINARQLAAIVGPDARTKLRDLADARAALAQLDRNIYEVILAIHTTVDSGWPARTGEGGGSSGISDPVGSMIAARSDALELVDQFRHLWSNVMAGAPTLVALSDRIIAKGAQMPVAPPSCSSGPHMAGYADWGHRDARGVLSACDALPDTNPETGTPRRGGLCSACYQRRYHWSKRTGNTAA